MRAKRTRLPARKRGKVRPLPSASATAATT
jgi:hypothetical protein